MIDVKVAIAFAPTQWPSSVILFYLGVRLVLFGMLTVGVVIRTQ